MIATIDRADNFGTAGHGKILTLAEPNSIHLLLCEFEPIVMLTERYGGSLMDRY